MIYALVFNAPVYPSASANIHERAHFFFLNKPDRSSCSSVNIYMFNADNPFYIYVCVYIFIYIIWIHYIYAKDYRSACRFTFFCYLDRAAYIFRVRFLQCRSSKIISWGQMRLSYEKIIWKYELIQKFLKIWNKVYSQHRMFVGVDKFGFAPWFGELSATNACFYIIPAIRLEYETKWRQG